MTVIINTISQVNIASNISQIQGLISPLFEHLTHFRVNVVPMSMPENAVLTEYTIGVAFGSNMIESFETYITRHVS